MVFRIAAAAEDTLAVRDGRGDALGGCAFDFPQRFPAEWIKAGKQVAAGQEQLVAGRNVQDDRRGVIRLFGPIAFPLDRAGLSIERRDDSAGVTVGRRNDKRPVHRRRCAIALMNDVVADLGLPSLFAFEAELAVTYTAPLLAKLMKTLSPSQATVPDAAVDFRSFASSRHDALPSAKAACPSLGRNRAPTGYPLLVRGGEKNCRPTTVGELAAPGIGLFQATFCDALHSVGGS